MVVELENGGANNMPIYEYRCNSCDEITEEFDKITSTVKTIECSFCGQPSTRIMSLGSFHLKGSGWYKDGYNDKKTAPKEEQSDKKSVHQERRENENKTTKVTADDYKDRWVSESEGKKVVNI